MPFFTKIKPKARTVIKWLIILSCWITVFALGYRGFSLHFQQLGEHRTIADIAYLSGQLFTVESGAVSQPVPWQLNFARFIAPIVMASSIVGAVLSVFTLKFKLFALRFFGGHIVLCGLGRKGSRLVREYCQQGKRVVVIEPDLHNPCLADCHNLGVLVLQTKADNDEVLRKVHLERAADLIAVSGSDSVNIDTVMRARKLICPEPDKGRFKWFKWFRNKAGRNVERFGPLRCTAHVTDPELRHLVKSSGVFQDTEDPFELELISVYEAGARVIIDESRLFQGGREEDKAVNELKVFIAGFGKFGQALLLRIAKDWQLEKIKGNAARLTVTVLDLNPEEKEKNFLACNELFLDGVTVEFKKRDVRVPRAGELSSWCSFRDAEAEQELSGKPIDLDDTAASGNAAFICFDNDTVATQAALNLMNNLPDNVPIIVRLSEKAGFADLIKEVSITRKQPEDRIQTIGFLDIASSHDRFLGGDAEIIARAFHEHYLDEQNWDGIPGKGEGDLALNLWHNLNEENRNSNLAIARDIDRKLALVDLQRVAVADRPIVPIKLVEEQIAILAEDEHERWCEELRADGYRYGEKKDKTEKTHPLIKNWKELSPEAQEFNRNYVAELPVILASADFAIEQDEASE